MPHAFKFKLHSNLNTIRIQQSRHDLCERNAVTSMPPLRRSFAELVSTSPCEQIWELSCCWCSLSVLRLSTKTHVRSFRLRDNVVRMPGRQLSNRRIELRNGVKNQLVSSNSMDRWYIQSVCKLIGDVWLNGTVGLFTGSGVLVRSVLV